MKTCSHDRDTNIFPLYLYSEDNSRTPNLKKEITARIESIVGETTPEEIFDYIYAQGYGQLSTINRSRRHGFTGGFSYKARSGYVVMFSVAVYLFNQTCR